jgi:serine/threonine-protein kinase
MATVYLGHDLRHDRDVAIKVLHPELAAALGGERFLTEIKTTAKLQHPHILPLLDSGEADGLLFYVMPYVTGETLRARLERERQLPIDEAVRIAREVADALGAAHAIGIIHRDIKPENILLQSGHALVADFGIALAVHQAGGARMTQTGLSLGTPQYMSPEQAMGERQIDGRADIYALGAVTYEMLTGDPPFTGNSVQAIVAKVMTERPAAPHVLRDTVPPHIETTVLRALAKLPADRPSTAGEFAGALAGAGAQQSVTFVAAGADSRAVRRWQYVTLGVTALAAISATLAVSLAVRHPAPPARIVHFTLPAASSTVGQTTLPAVSPDGRAVAYADNSSAAHGIRVRWIDRDEPELLPGTETASDITFSPDGKTIAYVTSTSELCTIGVDGRSPVRLASGAARGSGVSSGRDGYIYYPSERHGDGIVRIPGTGGQPEDVASVPNDSVTATGVGSLDEPLALDDGRTLIGVITGTGRGDGRIVAIDLRTKARTTIAPGIQAVTVRDGWLLYMKADGVLYAQRFDAPAPGVGRQAVPILTGVSVQDARAFIAVGRDGTLIYQPAASAVSHLAWVSRAGVEADVDSALARPFIGVALAPGGAMLAVALEEGASKAAIWLYDLARRTFTRLTPAGEMAYRPQWAPDGKRVLFASDHGSPEGRRSLFSVPIDGSDSLRLLVSRARHAQEISWPARGRAFAFREGFDDGTTLRDIFSMTLGDTTPHAIVATKADEFNPAVSPDGRWLAYTSDESGQPEVYITPFPDGGAKQQVSRAGGTSPVWAHSGRQLFYRETRGVLVATDIDGAKANPAGASHNLFDASRYFFDPNGQSFDVTPNDDRFLFIKVPPRASISVVIDWWAEVATKLSAANGKR